MFEVLKNNSAVANLIRTAKLHQIYSKISTGYQEGMNTLEQHLIALVESGAISREEAIRHANESNIITGLD